MDSLRFDIRYALRLFRKAPVFTAVAAATLALTIAVAILVTVGLVACALPAFRASGVDPIVVLREQ